MVYVLLQTWIDSVELTEDDLEKDLQDERQQDASMDRREQQIFEV